MIVSLRLDPAVLRELRAKLRGLQEVPARVIRREFAAAAPAVVAQQRARCPVAQGALRDSIRSRVTNRAGEVKLTFMAGGEALRPYMGKRAYNAYAIVQEVDTSLRHRVGGAGFMTQPAAAAYPQLMRRIYAGVDAGVKRGRA